MITRLHSISFAWDGGTRLQIEWARGRGRPCALPPLPHVVNAEEEVDPEGLTGVPPICWRQDAPALFDPFQLCENTEYFVDVTLPVGLAAAHASHQANPGWPFGERLANTFHADPVRRWRTNENGTITVPGKLSLRDQAGLLDLSLGERARLQAEVVCRKFGYLEEFRSLLDAIAEELAELLLQHDSPTSSAFDLSDSGAASNAALMFQMRYIMGASNLPTALDAIRRAFHTDLKRTYKRDALSFSDSIDVPDMLTRLSGSEFLRGGALAGLFRGYTPTELETIELSESTNTPENQYVRHFLEELRVIAHQLIVALEGAGRTASAREAQSWLSALDEELSGNTWRAVGPLRHFPSNSQVLQKRQGYHNVLKYDASLRMGLQLPWKRATAFADGLVGDIRPVNELYEYWCFFMLRKALISIATEDVSAGGSALDYSAGKLQVRLSKGRRSRIRFAFSDGAKPVRIHLFYNRVFPRPDRPLAGWQGSYTSRFDPDFSLELLVDQLAGNPQRHWLHFDAKYRARIVKTGSDPGNNPQDDEQIDNDYFEEMARLHKQDDLFKMHTYRDGILGSRGAYILYPGDGAGVRLNGRTRNVFVRHPTAFGGTPEVLFPSVGAFEFCPGREATQIPAVAGFIRSVLLAVSHGKSYDEETGLF